MNPKFWNLNLKTIVNFLSNHFELILYLNFALLIFLIALMGIVYFSDPSFRKQLYARLSPIILITIIVTEIAMFSLSGYVYWKNYKTNAEIIRFPENVLLNTSWVKQDFTVYFITGTELRSIKINGEDEEKIFQAAAPIREYYFSPNGKYLLIVSQRDLFLLDRKSKESELIDTLGPGLEGDQINGVITGIHWAPNSQKFCYEVSRWSRYATQDHLFIYSLKEKEKRIMENPPRMVSSVYWDEKAENLYYVQYEAQDISMYTYPFNAKVFRVLVEKEGKLLVGLPELVMQIPLKKASLPLANLKRRDINLFLEGDKLAFGRKGAENLLVSENGSTIGIDSEDYLYFIRWKWFRKRLFKVPREPIQSDISRYAYKGGELVVSNIRWIPSGRYVIMAHRDYGSLILEPLSGKVGHLFAIKGKTFGWYTK